MSIIRIPPHHYIHVLDQNTNIAHVEIGPLTYILQDNERVLFSPKRMIMVPVRHYCVVANPVARDDNGQVLFNQSGQAICCHGNLEIRLNQDPFPLYPGEEIQQDVTPLQIKPDTALCLRLRALQDFEDDGGEKRVAGDEWLFEGPELYVPRKEVLVLEIIKVRNEGGDKKKALRVAGAVAGVVAGGVGAVVAAPLVLGAIGFTSAGIAGGSIAAGMMSSAAIANGGGVAAGSLVAVLQSAGAVGLSATASAAVASVGGAVGGAAAAAAGWMSTVFGKKNEKKK